jgi:hypothetical protein
MGYTERAECDRSLGKGELTLCIFTRTISADISKNVSESHEALQAKVTNMKAIIKVRL